jgi:serine protease Do
MTYHFSLLTNAGKPIMRCRWISRSLCLLPGLVLLAACAAAGSPGGPAPVAAPVAATSSGPPGFSVAVRRGLPLTVGVYGVALTEPAEARAASPARRSGAAPARAALASASDEADDVQDSVNIGAGFLIDTDGTIATAAHVVADTSKIVVKMTDGRVFAADIVGVDAESDVALIRIPVKLAVAPALGQSASLRSGDWVVAIGDPYGLNRSVSAGVVGGGARHFAEDRDALFIQSDLALNPGNSGGPLLDAAGAVVGMNLRMMVGPFGTAGVSLSMPIELVLKIAGDIRDGTVGSRPRLGARFEDVSPPAALAAGRLLADGAVITEVSSGSIADRLGLMIDDIVVGFNGRPLSDSADMVKALLNWHSEAGTKLTVYRSGDYVELALD